MIQLQRLEGFYWVARAEGYARAARQFPYPITHAGVHQQVGRLEDELGVRLFLRVAKDRVALTPAGRHLYAFAAPFLEQLPHVEAALTGGSYGGTLRIHAAGQILKQLLPAWLRRLHRQRPDIDVALEEVGSADPKLLRSGEADLLVDYLPAVPSDIAVQQIGRVRAFLVLPSKHPMAQRTQVSLAALRAEPFISYSVGRRHRDLQMEALNRAGISPVKVLSAGSSDTILGFVAAGLGFSMVPSILADGPRMNGVRAYPMNQPGAVFPVYACWLKASINPLVQSAIAVAPRPV